MPRGDKTGPEGKGPKTGRGLGDCLVERDGNYPTCPNRRGVGQGQRQGRGFGQGQRQGRGIRQGNIGGHRGNR